MTAPKTLRSALRIPRHWLACSLLALLAPAIAIAEEKDHEHDHDPLATSATLSFNEILESAVNNVPDIRGAAVRDEQATAFTGAGRSWLAGRPSVVASYVDDSTLSNKGTREIDYGVQLPLWRPGEKAGTEQLGEDYRRNAELWRQSLRLTVAGRVRVMLADITESSRLLVIERAATGDAEQVLKVTQRLYETGALAKLDVMQSENLLLTQRQRELQAVAAVQDAEIVYRMQTGLATRPAAPYQEQQHEEADITPEHPLLQYLQSNVALAAGNVQQSEIVAKGNPQLTVGSRRERGDRFQPWIDSVAVSLSVPFGGKDSVSSRAASARLQQVDAEVMWHNAHRQLDMALHEAEHGLKVTREALPLARQQADLDTQRLDLAKRAFAAGELTMAQVLPTVQEARASARALVELQMKEQRLIAEYNQVLGVLP